MTLDLWTLILVGPILGHWRVGQVPSALMGRAAKRIEGGGGEG